MEIEQKCPVFIHFLGSKTFESSDMGKSCLTRYLERGIKSDVMGFNIFFLKTCDNEIIPYEEG